MIKDLVNPTNLDVLVPKLGSLNDNDLVLQNKQANQNQPRL